MRAQFLLIPAAIVASAPASAEIYLSLPEAQALLFPGASFTPNFLTLTEAQYQALVDAGDVTVWRREINAWKVSTGGWLVLDQVVGRDDWISYAVALDQNGAVKGIEILECLPRYDGIRNPAWLAQFRQLRHGGLKLDAIQPISGATLSSTHIAEGVKRVLATYTLFLAPDAH